MLRRTVVAGARAVSRPSRRHRNTIACAAAGWPRVAPTPPTPLRRSPASAASAASTAFASAAPRRVPHRALSSFWWSKKDEDEKDKGGDDDNTKDSEAEDVLVERKGGPLHVAGTSDGVDVGDSSSDNNNEGNDDDDDDGSVTTTDANVLFATSGGQSDPGDFSGLATVGEGEDAPRIPSVFVLPRSGQPVFPVPEVAQHMLLTDADLVARLQRQLETGVPYIGVFLRKGDEDAGEDAADRSDVVHDLDTVHEIGTLVQIAAIRELPGFVPPGLDQPKQHWHVMMTGHRRIRLKRGKNDVHNLDRSDGPALACNIEHLDTPEYDPDADVLRATTQEIMNTLREVIENNEMLQQPVQDFLRRRLESQDPPRLADFAASLAQAKPSEMQAVLDTVDVQERLDRALLLLKTEVERSRLLNQIKEDVEKKIGETQKKFMLREQLKQIKKELGLEKDDTEAVLSKFRSRLQQQEELNAPEDSEDSDAGAAADDVQRLVVPDEAQAVIDEEMSKLESLEKNSPEFNTTRNYLDWLTSIPWGRTSAENFDVEDASRILDEDHYGMKDVKDRILETIAVGKLKGNIGQGKIICLSGPPGTGKTSIGKSIARALNREYFRFSVGGLSDVAEIKGHRRTYIGAMPGKLIQCLKTTGTMNPLVLIDEIDKLGRGYQGDPASALLELLDPSQNDGFVDHYLDVPVDLSKVLFICTANVLETIPGPLLDRMEVIELSGYDTPDKVEILRRYLEPRAREDTGLVAGADGVPDSLGLGDDAVQSLIRWYCREAGVRNLSKQVDKVYRKLALKVVRDIDNDKKSWEVDEDGLADMLGKPPFTTDRLYADGTPPGVVMGLAWTAMGGAALYIESAAHYEAGRKPPGGGGVFDKDAPGGGLFGGAFGGESEKGSSADKGSNTVVAGGGGGSGGGLYATGMMGDVMKESTLIAHTVARAKVHQWDATNDYFERARVHMHVPEGATPKDGPSAGITMVTSLVSLALDRPVRPDLAMTGEVSLTGKVLPVGGIKEKTIAALRSGIGCLVFPEANRRDFDELPEYLRAAVEVHFVSHYDEVFDVAFGEDRFFDL